MLLICVLGLSSIPLLSGANFASASTGAANFLPNYFYPGNGTVDTDAEIEISLATAQYITTLLANKYPSSYSSYYGTTCTLNNYRTGTSNLQNYDNAVIYSKGHLGANEAGTHISLIDHYNVSFYDYDIATRTSSSKNTFTFIWHCRTAEFYNYGGSNVDAYGQAVGMPYAFTHNNNLAEYGLAGTQVYLGWKDKMPLTVYNYTTQQYHYIMIWDDYIVGSPQYTWGIDPTYNYAHVAYMFWANACGGSSTISSLNTLSCAIYGVNFEYTDLAGWLMVYGNRTLGLPA
jgi:hypothetical protein